MFADAGVTGLVVALAVILAVNLGGWGLTMWLDRRKAKSRELLAQRAAHEAVRLALKEFRGDDWSSSQ